MLVDFRKWHNNLLSQSDQDLAPSKKVCSKFRLVYSLCCSTGEVQCRVPEDYRGHDSPTTVPFQSSVAATED